MQEDPAVEIALVPASSNPMGSHITCDCCVQRSCSAKLYALRTGRHGGQREQRPARHLANRDLTKTEMQLEKRSSPKAYWNASAFANVAFCPPMTRLEPLAKILPVEDGYRPVQTV